MASLTGHDFIAAHLPSFRLPVVGEAALIGAGLAVLGLAALAVVARACSLACHWC